MGRLGPPTFDAQDCPFCDDWADVLRARGNSSRKGKSPEEYIVKVSATQFKRHVATHQEQLALFSVPKSNLDIMLGSTESLPLNSKAASSQLSDEDDYQASLVDESLEQVTEGDRLGQQTREVGEHGILTTQQTRQVKDVERREETRQTRKRTRDEQQTNSGEDTGSLAKGFYRSSRHPSIVGWSWYCVRNPLAHHYTIGKES